MAAVLRSRQGGASRIKIFLCLIVQIDYELLQLRSLRDHISNQYQRQPKPMTV